MFSMTPSTPLPTEAAAGVYCPLRDEEDGGSSRVVFIVVEIE